MKKHKPQTPKQCTINSTSTRILFIVCSILLSASITKAQLPFGQNNVVVLQVGDGVSLLNGRSRPVSLIEYTPAGVLVNEHPVSHSGGNRLTISGNAASEGQITRSADLLKIVIAGYDADTGLQSVGSTSASSVVPRVIGVMDGSGNYSRPTNSSTFFSGNGFRSAASNCDDYWGAGAGTSSGINYFGLGTPGNVSSFIEDNLIVNIFNGQLYFSTQNTFTGIYAVGTGLPTGTGNPSNVEIDLPFGSSPYAFAFNANSDVCYIADGNTDGTGGVQRWYKFLGFWTYDYTLNVGTNVGARGLTVDFSSPNPVIFATTSTNPTKLIKITDTGAGSGFTILATSTPNTAFRGVVFAPFESVTANPTSNSPVCEGTTLQLFANATGAPALTYLWSGVGVFSSSTASNPTVTGAATGYYTVTVSDACGSVTDSVYVVVNTPSESHDTISVCNTYTWNGNTFTTSGDYSAGPFTNSAGCDSSAFLNLTILYNSQSYDTIDVCNSYTWNGNTYTTSGDYSAGPFTNAAGCDSTAYLNLTIRYSSQSNDTLNVCNTYTWNGNTYTTSGDYSAGPFTNAAGCDSTAYLNLIIRYNSESHDTVSVCNTYTWNGNTYTTSGDYSAGPFMNAEGCDSTAYLNLIIRYSSSSFDTLVACETYEWNAIIYNTSGDYVAGPFTNAAGCDSIANIHLTVLHADDNNVCTADACDPLTGVTNTPLNYDDNDVCTIDACDPITGPSHTLINYDDNDVCTIDACDPITGPSHTLINYDDNNVCTIDACDPITGISHTPVNVDDGNPCTVDACDPVHGISHVDISGVFPVGSISGPLSQCVGSFNGVSIYSVPAIPGATSYSWSVPPGVVISNGQGTNSITVNWGFSQAAKGVYGPICVTVFTLCGYGQSCDFLDISMIAPVTPSSISGPSKLCPGDTAVYSVGIVARATSYNWTSTGNISIINGNGTNVITVVAGPGYTSGSLSVKTANACGSSPLRTKSLLLNSPSVPAAIIGSASGVCGMSNFIYSVAAVPNATGYFWTIPAGATLNNGQGSNSISVSFPGNFTSGTITVSTSNNCGTSAVRSLTVVGAPASPGIITGSNNVCTGSLMHYSVSTVMNTTTYTWTAPGNIATGQGTKEIDVQYGSSPASNQIITVTASNACGTSGIRILNQITIAFCPRISGSSNETINVYPNPNAGNFIIEMESEKVSYATISISDLSGRIIHSEGVTLTEGKNIFNQNADLSTGIYLVKITTDTEKIVKLIVE